MVLLLLQCLKNHGTFQKNGTITECKYSNMVQVYPEVKGFGKRSHGSSTRKIPKDPNKKPCTSIPSPPKLKRKYYTESPTCKTSNQNRKPSHTWLPIALARFAALTKVPSSDQKGV